MRVVIWRRVKTQHWYISFHLYFTIVHCIISCAYDFLLADAAHFRALLWYLLFVHCAEAFRISIRLILPTMAWVYVFAFSCKNM